ncbi:unnamed protein product [Bursaphelenchus xylophilus]|uniref:(pine wood nematode) hypothetical protein n=1 Tax=Bursaphelenchus xylophilus TaxID=6326 RepID=A0A1I7STJ6_BURXY|nr:unnamed protein product [Bursaphelenchus xylophilus]CAG9108327.1 unnamed protein product [Bursaphelenchus xylophilus]
MFRRVFLFLLLRFVTSFNVDIDHAAVHWGPSSSHFGFSVAAHFRQGHPLLLVGAPRADSGQPGTQEAGAVYACPTEQGIHTSCQQLRIEYPTQDDYTRAPIRLDNKVLHPEGKNHQMLGFVVQSTGSANGQAMTCAPLLRTGVNAYTDGVCYLLRNDLNHSSVINTCHPLPKKDRHNDYGACEQGFSGYMDDSVILTGLPGARKWTGGVFGRFMFTADGFPDSVDRWTMEVGKENEGIINVLASHDYLGYSVRYGLFGFPYETKDRNNFTVVSGATRYGQTGAVIFLPFYGNARPEDEKLLGLDKSRFKLDGRQLGSGFGYQVEVLDLNKDGFDDLLVSAPFEFHFEEDLEFGGAVYLYYSKGRRVNPGQEYDVFQEPIILRGRGLYSQFGLSLANVGDIDRDASHYDDFAVGAPFADHGHGAVYIFHGQEYDQFNTEPSQVILGSDLENITRKKVKTFGSAVNGKVDVDGNGFPDVVVGAYASDLSYVFKARAVVDVELDYSFSQKYIKINDGWGCPKGSKTCFELTTSLSTLDNNNIRNLLNLGQDVYTCQLKIISNPKAPLRALFVQNKANEISWPCGRDSLGYQQRLKHKVYIPDTNQDWVNPIKFNFTASMTMSPMRSVIPVIRERRASKLFETSFDKQCGEDNDCYTDISIRPILLNMTRTANGTYSSKVTERDSITIRFLVENKGERAFLAQLYVSYNQDELDEPRLSKNLDGIDVIKKEHGLAVLSLGNPLEEGKKLNFDLSFHLVRGTSERISTELIFNVTANSTSIEEYQQDNEWSAQVKLIKEADLELIGVSKPSIIRFSKGNYRPRYEEDIGSEVVHTYTVINHGPFYAKNVTVTINWPLKLNTNDEEWVLYTLEDPIIRYRGKVRTCKVDKNLRAINPREIYMDETMKLAYSTTYGLLKLHREKRELNSKEYQQGEDVSQLTASIFDNKNIKTKDVTEFSGATVKIVDINCKDESAICYPLTCNFDYIGTDESALIEIRSRLWNQTFSSDFQKIEYVAITSNGVVEVDPKQGIMEDMTNNFAQAITHAYPDRPSQQDKLNIWILLLAVLVGLSLLAILILICYKCGFFKRKRPERHMLHRAQLQHEMYG